MDVARLHEIIIRIRTIIPARRKPAPITTPFKTSVLKGIAAEISLHFTKNSYQSMYSCS